MAALRIARPARVYSSVLLVMLASLVIAACSSSATAPSTTTTTTTVTQTSSITKPACTTWAATLKGSDLPAASGTRATYRDALLAAGGGVKAVNGKAYAVWFPSGWATSSPRRVIFGLHGTDGNAEEDWWFNWKSSTAERSYAYIGLTYLDATSGMYDDEPGAYSNIKQVLDEIKASCEFGSPAIDLVGFSRGSAMTFGVAYLDLKDRRLFKAFGENSGAVPPGTPPTPTVTAFMTRNETNAYTGGKFWMYCGEKDLSHGSPMCDEMTTAKTFVTTYGGTVGDLYRDPTGGHGGLNSNTAALAAMYAYFQSVP